VSALSDSRDDIWCTLDLRTGVLPDGDAVDAVLDRIAIRLGRSGDLTLGVRFRVRTDVRDTSAFDLRARTAAGGTVQASLASRLDEEALTIDGDVIIASESRGKVELILRILERSWVWTFTADWRTSPQLKGGPEDRPGLRFEL
jgi:hypothetical protein